MPELTRKHLEHFAFNGHIAIPDEVAAMAKELIAARARTALLEETCQQWADGFERAKVSHRAHRSVLRTRIAELERENIRLSGFEQLHTEAGQSLGYVVVLKDDEGDLTCLASVFGPDAVRTAEGIGSGYAASKGDEYLIAELREVSGE